MPVFGTGALAPLRFRPLQCADLFEGLRRRK